MSFLTPGSTPQLHWTPNSVSVYPGKFHQFVAYQYDMRTRILAIFLREVALPQELDKNMILEIYLPTV